MLTSPWCGPIDAAFWVMQPGTAEVNTECQLGVSSCGKHSRNVCPDADSGH